MGVFHDWDCSTTGTVTVPPRPRSARGRARPGCARDDLDDVRAAAVWLCVRISPRVAPMCHLASDGGACSSTINSESHAASPPPPQSQDNRIGAEGQVQVCVRTYNQRPRPASSPRAPHSATARCTLPALTPPRQPHARHPEGWPPLRHRRGLSAPASSPGPRLQSTDVERRRGSCPPALWPRWCPLASALALHSSRSTPARAFRTC